MTSIICPCCGTPIQSKFSPPLFRGRTQELLSLLMRAQGKPVSIGTILWTLWGGENEPEGALGVVRVFVCRIRKRLGPEAIVNTYGGYRIGKIESISREKEGTAQ